MRAISTDSESVDLTDRLDGDSESDGSQPCSQIAVPPDLLAVISRTRGMACRADIHSYSATLGCAYTLPIRSQCRRGALAVTRIPRIHTALCCQGGMFSTTLTTNCYLARLQFG
jgi:hypothetical protein